MSQDYAGSFAAINAGEAFGDFVLVDGGQKYYFIRTDLPSQVLLGVGKKQLSEED